jgi:type II secretory pathway pseudopilin PulG
LVERRVIARDQVEAIGGFTLLEIGIALVVLALAFSLALPGIESVT